MNELPPDVSLVVKVTVTRRLVWRLRIGEWLVQLGGRIMGCSVELELV